MKHKSQVAQAAIRVESLSKKYPGTQKPALDNLTLEIFPGEVYGFLGPNGAGKSTAINILMNFIQPSSGSATIRGYDVSKRSLDVRKSIGYLSGDLAIYPKMTGRQFLDYMSDLQGLDCSASIANLSSKLKADLNKKSGELSRGNRQKIGIIQAFMHGPDILILDEPTSGLDPLAQEIFHELTQEAKQRGACIFMSSHVLGEVQKMCDRVGIIKDGKLVSENNISEMIEHAMQTFDIEFAKKVPIKALAAIDGIKNITQLGNTVTLHLHGSLSPLFALLAQHAVTKIDTRNLDLEEAFMRFYQDDEEKL